MSVACVCVCIGRSIAWLICTKTVGAFMHIKYVYENILYVIINIFVDWIMRQCVDADIIYAIDMPIVNWLQNEMRIPSYWMRLVDGAIEGGN